ncbi:MAG: HemK/PrmC family methyltransferase, partial [Candidatus Babeliales bacterium]
MIPTITQLVISYAEKLLPVCTDGGNAHQEIWWFLQHVTGKRKAELLTMHPQASSTIMANLREQLEVLVFERVTNKKPLQYIIGSVPFGDLTILVQPPILIPRPETEEWVLWTIEQYAPLANEPLTILDLCTGTGCIGLEIARALPSATVVGVDINPQAIALAEKNKALNAIHNTTFVQGDLFEPVKNQHFDLIVANPPYLDEAEWDALDPQVTGWEDKQALVAHDHGMAIYERIFAGARTCLTGQALTNR